MADEESSLTLGKGFTTRDDAVPGSFRTVTRHSSSAHLQRAVRFTRPVGDDDDGMYTVVEAGSGNAIGGETGWKDAEHQEGRSLGSNAAVQSRPIHQR